MTYKYKKSTKTDDMSTPPRCGMKDSKNMAQMIEEAITKPDTKAVPQKRKVT
jgi:hypothetical protein